MKDLFVISVDFDGTLCENEYPYAGEPNMELIECLKFLRRERPNIRLVLNTMRECEPLRYAVRWCKRYGLEFDAVNDNIKEIKAEFGNNPRKIFANVYLDDHNVDIDQFVKDTQGLFKNKEPHEKIKTKKEIISDPFAEMVNYLLRL